MSGIKKYGKIAANGLLAQMKRYFALVPGVGHPVIKQTEAWMSVASVARRDLAGPDRDTSRTKIIKVLHRFMREE